VVTKPEFHHVGFTVRDIEGSFAFYRDVVGMTLWNQEEELDVKPPEERQTEVGRAGVEISSVRSEAFDRLTNNPGSEIKYLMLASADRKLVFQLIEYVAGGGPELELDHNRPGSMHFSFFVDDVDAKRAEIERRGDVKIISDVVQITPSMRSFYVADPDGVPVEFLQVVR
jgi:catechol 2,3-dioxygenase-like lactoylglutathione lyase family enzyme